jgi:endonuclease G, mitochondrial
MALDPMTIARARRAIRQAVQQYLFDPNVSLIDFGYPEHDGQIVDDELAIRFHVRQKLTGAALESAAEAGNTRPIPPVIGGFQTDVPQGTYRPYRSMWSNGWWLPPAKPQRQTRLDTLKGGISISDVFHTSAGTLGCKVIDRFTGDEMILSNWHVLVVEWTARPGQRICQPGRLDGGVTSADAIATLTRDAMSVNLDAAVAKLTGDRQLLNDQLNLGGVTGVAQAELGMEVAKSGRTTGVTHGRVTAVDGMAKIRYNGIDRVIRNVMTIEPSRPAEQVSAPGDSGSVWLNPDTMQAVSLHFAGSDFPERGLAIDLQTILDTLNVDLALEPRAARTSAFARRSLSRV